MRVWNVYSLSLNLFSMKRPLLWLGLGYIAGVAAAIVSKSDKSNLSLSDVRDEFVNLHKNMWNRINELELTEDVRKELLSIRTRLKEEIAYMEEDFSEEIAKIKAVGSPKVDELRTKIEDLYTRREEHINLIRSEAEDLVHRLKQDGNKAYQTLESSLTNIFEDTKYHIEKKVAEIKRSLNR